MNAKTAIYELTAWGIGAGVDTQPVARLEMPTESAAKAQAGKWLDEYPKLHHVCIMSLYDGQITICLQRERTA